mgnify:FL=1
MDANEGHPLIIYRCYDRWKGVFEVERFPPNQVHQAIYCVIPGKPGSSTDRLQSGGVKKLDPGSSLFEVTVEK